MADPAKFTLRLLSAEGFSADEPHATVRFMRPDGTLLSAASGLVFPPAHEFALPAFPAERSLHCQLTFSRYRLQQSAFFTPDAARPTNATVIAMRDPDQWAPAFTKLDDLPNATFKPLTDVIDESDQVDFKDGTSIGRTGSLGKEYDNLSSDSAQLAKMCLLNLYSVLAQEVDPVANTAWFDHVTEIVRIDRERFVAVATSTLWTSVATILKDLKHFGPQGFFPEISPGLHVQNFPARFGITDPRQLITIKKRYEQGNVQFTVAPCKTDQGEISVVDIDMDEHAQLALHTIDLFKHPFDGGTHPIDIHEYIVARSAENNGGASTIDLGYVLWPHDTVNPPALGTPTRLRR